MPERDGVADIYARVEAVPMGGLAAFVVALQPTSVVELGTGGGVGASHVMGVLPRGATFTTVNWPAPPSGDDSRECLAPWAGDERLVVVLGDTRDPEVAQCVPDGVDLLYIDSTHTRECAEAELALWGPKLADGAVVVMDDLTHNDLMQFWDALPYEKCLVWGGCGGMFRYAAEGPC